MVEPHVIRVMDINITADEIVDESNMEVEPPITSFDLTANKKKKNYSKSKNVLDNILIEDCIAVNKSIIALARKANMIVDDNMGKVD